MTPQEIINLLPENESETLTLLFKARDRVGEVMNSLVYMAVTLAIAADVSPEIFAEKIIKTWSHMAEQVNEARKAREH